ncbi:MAG: hypothetical protein ABIM30_01260 [candidate division WOR-3 bacterium]
METKKNEGIDQTQKGQVSDCDRTNEIVNKLRDNKLVGGFNESYKKRFWAKRGKYD